MTGRRPFPRRAASPVGSHRRRRGATHDHRAFVGMPRSPRPPLTVCPSTASTGSFANSPTGPRSRPMEPIPRSGSIVPESYAPGRWCSPISTTPRTFRPVITAREPEGVNPGDYRPQVKGEDQPAVAVQRKRDQFVDELRIGQPLLPHLRIHRVRGEARHRVDLVDEHVSVGYANQSTRARPSREFGERAGGEYATRRPPPAHLREDNNWTASPSSNYFASESWELMHP